MPKRCFICKTTLCNKCTSKAEAKDCKHHHGWDHLGYENFNYSLEKISAIHDDNHNSARRPLLWLRDGIHWAKTVNLSPKYVKKLWDQLETFDSTSLPRDFLSWFLTEKLSLGILHGLDDEWQWKLLDEIESLELEYENEKGLRVVLMKKLDWVARTPNIARARTIDTISKIQSTPLDHPDYRTTAIMLTRAVKALQSLDKSSSEVYRDLCEKMWHVNQLAGDINGMARTLTKLIKIEEESPQSTNQRLEVFINQKINLEKQLGNEFGQFLYVVKLLNLRVAEDDTDSEYLLNLGEKLIQLSANLEPWCRARAMAEMHDLKLKIHGMEPIDEINSLRNILELQQDANEFQSVGMTLQKMIRWYERNENTEVESIIKLFNEMLSVDVKQGRYKSIDMTLNQYITFLESNGKKHWPKIRSLHDVRVNQSRLSGELENIRIALQDKADWLEKHRTSALDEIWSCHDEIMALSETDLSKRIALRNISRFLRKNPDLKPRLNPDWLEYPNNCPFDVLFHLSSLLILEPQSIPQLPKLRPPKGLADSIYLQCISKYTSEFGSLSSPQQRWLFLMLKSFSDIPQLVDKLKLDSVWANQIIDVGELIIFDGPNILHSLSKAGHPVEDFIDYLMRESRPKAIHLTLNCLDDFPNEIQRIHACTDSHFVQALMPTLPEDLCMLIVSSLSGGTIVSNDKFRSEEDTYSGFFQESVFENISEFSITKEGFKIVHNESPPGK